MIEDVEEFCTKFQGSPFANPGVLMKCKVPVVDPRPMEEPALCVTDGAKGFRREGGGIEEQIPRLSRVEEMNRLTVVVRHIGAAAATQRVIVILGECDRKTGIETRDSRNCPAREQLALYAVGRSGKRQIVAITDDKVVRYIESRERPTQAWIEGVDGVVETGRVIDGLGSGIRCKQTESAY